MVEKIAINLKIHQEKVEISKIDSILKLILNQIKIK